MEGASPKKGKSKVQAECSSSPKQFRWTHEMECHFLDLLQNQDQMGNRVGGTFTSQAYRNILFELQSTYGTSIQKNHLKNKIRSLKQNYSEFKDAFRGMGGFAWNWETKKFDAEQDVWEALIQVLDYIVVTIEHLELAISRYKKGSMPLLITQETFAILTGNPRAASLRNKCCYHWEQMNTMWASSRAVGMKASTAREHSKKVQEQLISESFELPFQSTHIPNSSVNQDVSGSPNLSNAISDTCLPNYSGSGHSLASGIAKTKRKASDELTLQMLGKKLESSMEHVARAIVESAGMLSNKSPRPFEESAHLFKSLEDMDLCQEDLLESYSFLSKNEKEANMFLGTSQRYRLTMLRKIMTSRFMP